MARMLVTGATGFVGGRVAARLRSRGDEVVAAVRTRSTELARLGVEQAEVGLELTPDLLAGVDGVVHAAASVGPSLDEARHVNRDGTRHVARAALSAGVRRLVHLSTTSVYDRQAVGDVVVDEDAPQATERPGPTPSVPGGSAYAITKAEAEVEIVAARVDGLSAAILRPPAVLGAAPTSTWGTRVPRQLLAGRRGGPHPETTFAFVHIEDLVDAVVAAIDSDMPVTANVVGGHTTRGAYLRAVAALLPGDVRIPDADPDDVPWRGSFAGERLTALLGVAPRRTFDDGMAEIAASWETTPPDAG